MNRKQNFHGSDFETIEARYGISKENIVNFAANVNPLGISFLLRQTLAEHLDAITSYPDREYTSLRQRIASYVHTDKERILVGNGCTELISLFIQITRPKRALLIAPTYSEYGREVSLAGGEYQYFPLTEGDSFTLDLSGLKKALQTADLLVLCNPNNPTASLVEHETLRAILAACKENHVTLLIDETYIEFAPHSEQATAVPLASEYDNLIILRGISKFFAAPGLRLGYAICGNQDLLAEINSRKNPWTINSLAAIAGEILFTDNEYIQKSRKLIASERARVCTLLGGIKEYKIYPSQANFVLCKSLKEDLKSEKLCENAIKHGLMIRDCSDFPFLDDTYFRFCFMLPEQNDRLLQILKDAARNIG